MRLTLEADGVAGANGSRGRGLGPSPNAAADADLGNAGAEELLGAPPPHVSTNFGFATTSMSSSIRTDSIIDQASKAGNGKLSRRDAGQLRQATCNAVKLLVPGIAQARCRPVGYGVASS